MACLAEVDDRDDILLVRVRGRKLERVRALVGDSGPKLANLRAMPQQHSIIDHKRRSPFTATDQFLPLVVPHVSFCNLSSEGHDAHHACDA
jgi:hypothetical protein